MDARERECSRLFDQEMKELKVCRLHTFTSSSTSQSQARTMPRAQDPTQSLLRWGIENAAPGTLAETAQQVKDGKRPDLSTEMLKQIMGVSDADRMRECLMVIQGNWVDRDGKGEIKPNQEISNDDKYRAWDDLEMVSLNLSSISPSAN